MMMIVISHFRLTVANDICVRQSFHLQFPLCCKCSYVHTHCCKHYFLMLVLIIVIMLANINVLYCYSV